MRILTILIILLLVGCSGSITNPEKPQGTTIYNNQAVFEWPNPTPGIADFVYILNRYETIVPFSVSRVAYYPFGLDGPSQEIHPLNEYSHGYHAEMVENNDGTFFLYIRIKYSGYGFGVVVVDWQEYSVSPI